MFCRSVLKHNIFSQIDIHHDLQFIVAVESIKLFLFISGQTTQSFILKFEYTVCKVNKTNGLDFGNANFKIGQMGPKFGQKSLAQKLSETDENLGSQGL